jgi:predicted Zn-ribbon and HTH transcriptional regulator
VSTRTDLLRILTAEPTSVSALARALRRTKGDIEDHLRHAIRTARAAGHEVVVEPARCRTCGFAFGEEKLVKPGKCPRCRGTRLIEARVSIRPADAQ